MGLFNSIPIRANGDRITAAWVNVIRTSLISAFGEGVIAQTSFTIADNQAVAANITNLSFDSDDFSSVDLEFEIKRSDSIETLMERRDFRLLYKSSSWQLEESSRHGDDTGVTFSVVTTDGVGQLKYTSTDMAGSGYTGTLKYKAKTFDV